MRGKFKNNVGQASSLSTLARKIWTGWKPVLLCFLLTACGEREIKRQTGELRIVAMAPSIAEILFALGLADETVGVNRYSAYPPEVKEKPFIGGLYDPNWERVVSLRPTLAIGLDSQRELASQLNQLGIPFVGVAHERVDDIMKSILEIGDAAGTRAPAEKLYNELKTQMEKFSRTPAERAPKILVCVGRDETFSRMYVAAKNTFYDDIITAVGGVNACVVTSAKYPEISPDGLATMRPDIIIDILPEHHQTAPPDRARTVVMTNDYAWTPGPRFILLMQDFSEVIREYDSN